MSELNPYPMRNRSEIRRAIRLLTPRKVRMEMRKARHEARRNSLFFQWYDALSTKQKSRYTDSTIPRTLDTRVQT